MSLVQDRLLMAASAVLESISIYAAMAVLGLMLHFGGSPLSWVTTLAILGVSLITARTSAMIIMHSMLPFVLQMAFGAIVIYIALGAQVQIDGQGFSLGWIGSLYSEDAPQDYRLMVGLTALFGVILWWRGGRLASIEYPVEHISRIFRVGLMILAVAAIVDIIADTDLKIFILMFVFFAAGLGGLSVAHLLPASEQAMGAKSWSRVISGIIVLVVLVGLLFSLLQKGMLNFISTPVEFVLKILGTVFFYVILVPLIYIVNFLVQGMFSLLSRFAPEGEPLEFELGEGLGEMFQQLQEDTADTGPSALLQYLEWTVLVVLLLVVLYFLGRSFRRRLRWKRVDDEGIRESVAEDSDAATDLGRLLFNLLHERFRRKKVERRINLPDDEVDIVDVFRIYFGMLILAEDRGHPRPESQTPDEYQSTLERIFPQQLVRTITNAFNRACYGHRPSSRTQIEEMRQGLDQANSDD